MAGTWRGATLIAAALAACSAVPAGCESEGEEGRGEPEGAVVERSAGDSAWKSAPVLPVLDTAARDRLAREVARSEAAGMRAGVFAKVGDSNSDYPAMLYGLGCREVELGARTHLAPTHRRYTSVGLGGVETHPECRPANSFSRDSAATESNATTSWVLTPVGDPDAGTFAQPPAGCPEDLNPLECEIETIRPRWVTIMIGSGDAIFDQPVGEAFAGNLERIIALVRRLGPVPVIATVPPAGLLPAEDNRRIEAANRTIYEVARRRKVPLINVWRAMTGQGMVNDGLSPDGLHLGVYGGDADPEILANSANLSSEAVRHGANRRNLIWLQALHRLDRAVAAAAGT